MQELSLYAHSMGQNAHHLVFRTKYNLKFFRQELLRDACELFLRGAAQKHGMKIHSIKILPDHVHILLEIPPTLSITEATRLLKGHTSRKFFQRFTIWRGIIKVGHKKAHLWSRWRFSRSVGNVNAGIIENYINNSSHNQFVAYKSRQTKLA